MEEAPIHAPAETAFHAESADAPDVLRAIRLAMESLSSGQRRIAELVLDNPAWAVNTNVEELARAAEVSAPTIVRFCRTVGCEGVKDFKLKLAGDLARGTPFLHRGVSEGDSAHDVVRNVVGSLTAVLSEWQRLIDPALIDHAAKAINGARRIDCYGTGATSNFLAQDLQARLFRLDLNTTAYSDAHFQLVAAATLTPADVVVAISFVGRMPSLLEVVRLAKARGATIIAITRGHTPLAALADIVLASDVPRDATMRVGTEAYVVQLLVIEMLMVMTGLLRGPAVIGRLREIRDILQTHGVDSDDPSLLHWGWRPLLGEDEAQV